MFDILLGRKFSNKCKHSVKCIKCRIEPIRKKKQVMVKYLRKDVADLLAGGHEANAFGRIDALIVEINHASCYDMIEQYCGCLLEHLSTMCKERECPKEAMEAVATLIFAAARFSDLPELIDLRSVFTKRYQTRMESCINKEFVEKIQNKSFSKVRKLEVMEDIAQEFSVNWNSNMFENKMSNQSAQVHGKALKHQVVSNENEKQFTIRALQKLQIKPEEQIKFQTTPTNVNNRALYTIEKTAKMIADESENAKPEYTDKNAIVKTKYNQNENYRNDFIVEGKAQRGHERISLVANERQTSAEVVHTRSTDGSTGTIVDHGGSAPSENVNELDHNGQDRWLHRPVNASSRKTFYSQPPYRKPNLNNTPNNSNYVNPTNHEKSAGGRGNMPKEEIFKDDSNLKSEIQTKQGKETARTNYIHGDVYYEQRFIVKKTPSAHRRHGGRRRTIETSEDAGYDKEEEIMDKLLMLYSKKGTNNEPRKSRTKLREAPKEPMAGAVPLPEHLDENGLHPKSLSRELTSSAENGFINRARATSKPTGTVPSRQPEIEIPAACIAQH